MAVHKSDVTKQLKTRKRFAQVPNELFAADISVHARLVWAYLMSEGPGWDSSVANVARNLRISRSSATRAIEELRKHSMISTQQTKSGTDFTMHTSNHWNLEWIGLMPSCLAKDDAAGDSPQRDPVTADCAAGDPVGCMGLSNPGAPADRFMGGIQNSQHSNTLNTSNTGERERSRCEEQSEVISRGGDKCRSSSEGANQHLDYILTRNNLLRENYRRLPEPLKMAAMQITDPEEIDSFLANHLADYLPGYFGDLLRNGRGSHRSTSNTGPQQD